MWLMVFCCSERHSEKNSIQSTGRWSTRKQGISEYTALIGKKKLKSIFVFPQEIKNLTVFRRGRDKWDRPF